MPSLKGALNGTSTVEPAAVAQGDHMGTNDNWQHMYHTFVFSYIAQNGAGLVTYSSVIKLWFTLSVSASAVVPESPI